MNNLNAAVPKNREVNQQELQAKVLLALRTILSLPNFAGASDRNPFRLLTAKDQCGYQPLHYAAASGNVQLLHLLLDIFSTFPSQFQQLTNCTDYSGNSALHFAVERAFPEIVSVLVEQAGVNVNLVNNRGLTCLHLAASFPPTGDPASPHNKVARYLLSHGADPNISDVTGATPLHTACSLGNSSLVTLLVEEFGASPNVQDDEGETPLFYAVRDQQMTVVRKLFDYDIQVDTRNMDGETVMETVSAVGDTNMVAVLESFASRVSAQQGKQQNGKQSIKSPLQAY